MKLRQYQEEIIEKTRNSFRKSNKRPLVVLPCGSGKTVCFADMAQRHIKLNKNNHVWFLVHRRELIDQTIETFERFNISQDNIFVGMVQTISRHPGRYRKPTMIIFDEAHHATAKTWMNIVDYFDGVPMVGLTATPTRLNGDALGNIFDDLVVGVDSEWLMNNDYLCEYDYYAPKIIDYDFKTKGSDFDQEQVAELLEKSKIYGEITRYIDLNRKTIIYSPSIKFSQNIANSIPGAVHFDGNTPKAERKKIVEDFKNGKIKILTNVDLIGEGFDVPDCDCVMLLRPTQSLALYIQQSMRCLRPNDNKRAVIYDFVGNVYRHGMPTDSHEWTLDGKMKCQNINAEPDLLVRECQKCYKVYKGIKRICPYCGNDNGKTRKEIEHDEKVELEKIEAINRKRARMEVGMARDYETLVALGIKRGYKNPQYWARIILKSRHKKI